MAKRLFGFESIHEPLISRSEFVRRLGGNLGVALIFIGISLAAGMAGYHHLEGMSWMDSFVNAAMILSGMGPMGELKTSGGKFFAGCYALYSGLAVVVTTGFILAPVIHRLFHRMHLESDGDS